MADWKNTAHVSIIQILDPRPPPLDSEMLLAFSSIRWPMAAVASHHSCPGEVGGSLNRQPLPCTLFKGRGLELSHFCRWSKLFHVFTNGESEV